MLWVAGFTIALVLGISAFFGVRALSAVFRANWKVASVRVVAAAASLALAFILLSSAASALGRGALLGPVDPSQKARRLGEIIADLMNISVFGLPLGLLAGLLSAFRDRRTPR
jgi:hypothetical protein